MCVSENFAPWQNYDYGSRMLLGRDEILYIFK